MKHVFGKLSFWLLLFISVSCCAGNTPETPHLNEGQCAEPIGFIMAYYWHAMHSWNLSANYMIGGYHPDGGYYSTYRVHSDGTISASSQRIYYHPESGQMRATSSAHYPLSQCAQDFQDAVIAMTDQEREDPGALYDHFFGQSSPESRLPMDTDLNGNGRLDYYDLDSPHYQDYLAMCAFFQIAPGDLRDYMYWYQNEIADWHSHRMNVVDSNGDGWSDGYKAIRGYGPYDEVSFIGRPDIGSSSVILGGVASTEPWRYEQYADGWSRGHVYDMGYDPFGTAPIETINADFNGPPDWFALDSSGDGVSNAQKLAMGQDPYKFIFQSGFVYQYNERRGYWEYMGGVSDGDFPNWTDPPTADEWMAEYEDKYGTGNYDYHPGDYTFGHDAYDTLLEKFEKIRINIDSVRPEQERDYKVYFVVPIPGHTDTYSISVVPDESMPAGAALNSLRLIIRAMSAVVISYLFIRHVWLVIRQY